MRVILHIGLSECGAKDIQAVLQEKRDLLAKKGILFPRAAGGSNHTRLYMAVSDPADVDNLRFNRGAATPEKQQSLREKLARELSDEVAKHDPHTLILSAEQLCTLPTKSAIERLRALLLPLSDDITIVAHLDEQARVLTRHYGEAILSGRTASLAQEIELADSTKPEAGASWHDLALEGWKEFNPAAHAFPDIQAPPFWLDYVGLQDAWEQVFGPDSVTFRPYDPLCFTSDLIVKETCETFDITDNIGKVSDIHHPAQLSAASLARMRQINTLLVALLGKGRIIPRQLWRRLLTSVSVDGDPIAPGTLVGFSKHFEKGNRSLLKKHRALTRYSLKRDRALPIWSEADATRGFRASQFVTAILPRINNSTRAALKETRESIETEKETTLSPVAQKLLSKQAQENFADLNGGRFAPHNNTGRVNEAELAAPYSEITRRDLPKGNSGKVIVGCMKDEAPYILEWVAYHRSIGIDNFIIYTNACSDGTSQLLDRLQELGVLEHRNNDNWKGNSPQQYALNQSLNEPVIKNAEWVIHIDVDEFINVRVGNGTLDDFLARVPDATNVAMTWRLFGHNNVTRLNEKLVIDQFDHAAPKHCPKPHIVWGFKAMVKNIGAYEKLSCHRPNKLKEGKRGKVAWVNGSGQPISDEVKDKGWRSNLKTVGYDLLQLNHYALRSAESYLIKRQRGRALHVDRSIGINYWVRMDWSDNPDNTIKRNIPRLRAELERLCADTDLLALHEAGLAWHKAKAAELHQNPEFSDLYAQALETKLTELERVAFSLALDMDN
ncbi:MAG: glycosyltransferase family 2 protein [Rhodobacteraceae bacterium]|nr:glycosyltransferase family 2 protein [Paracoccaceae bacterium]